MRKRSKSRSPCCWWRLLESLHGKLQMEGESGNVLFGDWTELGLAIRLVEVVSELAVTLNARFIKKGQTVSNHIWTFSK